MRALTIKQPWASLIVHGVKDIENRTWRTKQRGTILIHSSAQFIVGPDFSKDQVKAIKGSIGVDNVSHDKQRRRSCIIGEVDIIDCVLNHDSIWAEQMAFDVCEETGIHILRKGQPYIWNWVLANPVLYDNPITNVKGALSFWNYEPSKI